MPVFKSFPATRIVALPEALDAIEWPEGALQLRFAPDEMVVSSSVAEDAILHSDPHAIVVPETGFVSLRLAAAEARDFLERSCDWVLPNELPAFAQGAIAGLPVKLWVEREAIVFIVPAAFATEMEERMA